MERVLNEEEKIKKAEERYYSKRNINIKQEEKTRISFGLLRKIFLQLFLCFIIYVSFFFIQAKNFVFSNYVLDKTKYMLNYDINVGALKMATKDFFNANIFSKFKKGNIENENTENTEVLVKNEQQISNEEPAPQDENNVVANEVLEEASSISQMIEDAKYIQENYSIIKPLTGTITSRFGIRNPTTATVPTYHTGIDIATNTGTAFVSAISGKVELVSSQGDYRKTFKNSVRRCYDTLCTL